jgi:hypothetical protein
LLAAATDDPPTCVFAWAANRLTAVEAVRAPAATKPKTTRAASISASEALIDAPPTDLATKPARFVSSDLDDDPPDDLAAKPARLTATDLFDDPAKDLATKATRRPAIDRELEPARERPWAVVTFATEAR